MFSEKDTEFTEDELLGINHGWIIMGRYRNPVGVILIDSLETLRGYQVRDCLDCFGSGIFLMPDNKEIECNTCKGKGKLYLNV